MLDLKTIVNPKPWLVAAILLNISGIADGFPTVLSLESLVTLAVLGTTLATLVLNPGLRSATEGKVALLMVLLLGLVPLASSLAGEGDLKALAHPGYRHLMKFLFVAVCWTAVLRTKKDARLALHTMLLGYVMLAGVALYRFLILHEVDPDIGRMALAFRHGDPNFLCLHMAGGSAIAFWHLSVSTGTLKDRAWSLFAVVGLALFAVTAWFTASRGGLMAFVAEVFIISMLVPARVTRLARVGALATALVLVFAFDGERLIERLTLAQDASATGRIASVEAGFDGLSQSPVFGSGFDQASRLMMKVDNEFRFLSTEGGITIHNTFLQIGAELGFVGLAVYATALLLLLAAIRKAFRAGDRTLAFVATGWLAAILLAMVGLPLAYNATMLGSLILLFAELRASDAPEQGLQVA